MSGKTEGSKMQQPATQMTWRHQKNLQSIRKLGKELGYGG